MFKMYKMGLHVFYPAWQTLADSRAVGSRYSTSFTDTTLTIFGTGESMSFPVQTCTRVSDLKEALANTCMCQAEEISFVVRQGSSYRKQLDYEEIGRRVVVKGITSFKPQPQVWPHPICILGTGYNGIKTACHYLREGNDNIVCFDRNSRVGGYCWITAANKTSKLQTEMGSFHVWWGLEYANSTECGGWPTAWETWPKKDRILEHFHLCAQDYGMLPHCRFRTNVSEMDIVGPKDAHERYYNLTVAQLDKPEGEYECPVSVMYNYPGSMTKNRIIEYPGEDVFDGHIGYGMNDDMPYDHIEGTNVAILGNGAFAVENIRTCCEYKAEVCYLVTRRKNLPSPRVPCWFVHQGPIPTPGRMVLNMFKPMYDIAGMGDPWEYWSVHAPQDRSRATVIQNSRFGIGDVTFLALIYGKMEYIESTVKRFTRHTLHLVNGRKLENVQNVVKSLGLLGDFEFDRLHKMKELIGVWCSGDWRRIVAIDPLGMNAANFTTFSTGIGTYGNVVTYKFLHDFPKEVNRMMGMGLMQQLPKQKGDEKMDRPAYVTDVKFQMTAGIIIDSMCPMLQQRRVHDSPYKYELYHRCHPTRKFLEVCREDWDKYQSEWKAQGCTHEYVPYPYTYEMIAEYFQEYSQSVGVSCGPEGPESAHQPAISVSKWQIGQAAAGGEMEKMERENIEPIVSSQHAGWWHANAAKQGSMLRRNQRLPPEVQQEVMARALAP